MHRQGPPSHAKPHFRYGKTIVLMQDTRNLVLGCGCAIHLDLTGTKKAAITAVAGPDRQGERTSHQLMSQPALMHDETRYHDRGVGDEHNLSGHCSRMFVKHDGVQCGYCTPGQICSATAMLEELASGLPSNVRAPSPACRADRCRNIKRMLGNICRCAALPNIVDLRSRKRRAVYEAVRLYPRQCKQRLSPALTRQSSLGGQTWLDLMEA